jgi:hypothetical protein
MKPEDYEAFGIRVPMPGETPLSWQECLVLLSIKEEDEVLS